jgi:hypothetical protein
MSAKEVVDGISLLRDVLFRSGAVVLATHRVAPPRQNVSSLTRQALRGLSGALLCLAAFSAAAPAHAASETLRLSLDQAGPASVDVQMDGREVLVLLRQPLSAEGQARLSGLAAPGSLVEGVTIGQGAVRLRLSQPVVASVQEGAGVTLLLTPAAATERTGDTFEERRLLILEAQDEAQRGGVLSARDRLARAAAERPDDIDLMLALADLEAQAGDWRQGLTLYDRALRADPGAEDVIRARRALALRNGPRLGLEGFAAFAPGGERVQGGTLRGSTPVVRGWRADLSVEVRHGQADNAQRADNREGGSIDATRTRGEFALAHEWEGFNAVTRVGVHGADDGAGALLQQSWQWAHGKTILSGDYHRPYWETLIALRENAKRDSVMLLHEAALGRGVALRGGAGYVRYGVPGDSGLSDGPAFNAAVTWTLTENWLWNTWTPALAYRFDAEYISRIDAAAPGTLPVLDVRQREVHAVTATVSRDLGPGHFTATAGFAADRYGGTGPVGNLSYVADGTFEEPLTVRLDVSVGPSLATQSRSVWRIGAAILWRFGLERS